MIGVRALRIACVTVWTVGQLVSQPLGATEQGRVRVEMIGAGGERLDGDRYIALVAEGKPVREPIEEALLEADAPTVTWSVPPGRYRAVCSEASHWWAEGRAFEVGAGEDFEASCELRPLVPVEGRVLSRTSGEPVARARVGYVHGFLEDFRLRLSPLGEAHAAPGRTTRTDPDGRFVLRGPADAKVPVWVEADGFEPRLLPGVQFPGDGAGALEPIGLDPGGRLKLELMLPGGLEPRRTSAVGDVLFSGDPDAVTEIELPEGQIEGSVLSPEGHAISGATVIAEQVSERRGGSGSQGPVTSHLTVNTKSDARGAFALDSLGPGEWTLRARLGEERSARQTTSLAPGELAAGVALTLEDRNQLVGRVLDSYGQGVSGASGIGVVPSSSANGVPEIVRFASADDGRFEVDLTGIRRQPVNFTVVAPGHPVFAVRELLDEGLEIQVPAIGGGVELAGDDGIWGDLRLNQLALVDDRGAFVQLSALGSRLERRTSGSLVVDNLAEGRWRLVAVASLAEFQVLVGGQGLALEPLATFEVVGGQWSRAEVGRSRPNADSK